MIIRNFLFHRVSPQKDLLWPPMKPELFDKIIHHLIKKYSVVPLEKFLAEVKNHNSNKKLATVLFDDGFKDNIEFAAPILKKYNCPASFYVVTDCIEFNTPTWTYLFDYRIQNTKINKINLNGNLELPIKINEDISSPEKKLALASRLKPLLKKLNHHKRIDILAQLFSQLNDVQIPEMMMNWKEINQLKNEGFEIGSHSKSHLMLGDINDESLLSDELQLSANAIEKNTGKFPLTISYPVGSYNGNVISTSKKCGYKFGLAVNQKFYDTNKDDNFSIPRMELYDESWFKTKMRMNGLIEKIKSLK